MLNIFKRRKKVNNVMDTICCTDCDLKYYSKNWINFYLINIVWDELKKYKPIEQHPFSTNIPLLCLPCAKKRLEELNIRNVGVWFDERECIFCNEGEPPVGITNYVKKPTVSG